MDAPEQGQLVQVRERQHPSVFDRPGHPATHGTLPGKMLHDACNHAGHGLGRGRIGRRNPEPLADKTSRDGVNDRTLDAAPADINAENVRMSCTVHRDRRFHVLMGSTPMRELM